MHSKKKSHTDERYAVERYASHLLAIMFLNKGDDDKSHPKFNACFTFLRFYT